VEDIESLRHGRLSEGLQKYTHPSAEDRCFSILFKDHHKHLDLMAASAEDARRWVSGLEKLVSNMRSLSRQTKSEQYPSETQPASCCFSLGSIPDPWSKATCTLLIKSIHFPVLSIKAKTRNVFIETADWNRSFYLYAVPAGPDQRLLLRAYQTKYKLSLELSGQKMYS
jgi:hypothetical protein